jgi:HSP20 family protein
MLDLIPFDRRERNIFKYFDDMEKNFFGKNDLVSGLEEFRTDIVDKGDKYVLKAELPGFKKDEIKVEVQSGYLSIQAEHNEESKEEKDNYVRRERRYGAFARSFDVSGIDTSKIEANYKDGILELELPKVQETTPDAKQIAVK